MTMTARERMLGRLRAAAPTDPTVGRDGIDGRIAMHYAQARQPASVAELAQQMVRAMTASRADVWCASEEEWPAQLAARLVEHGARRLLLDPAGKEGAALQKALPPGVEATPFARPIESWKAELFDTVDVGFTVARSGIAATGTLILAPDAGTPRTVSLAPPLHVALVYASTLFPDMHAAVRAERWSEGLPANLVLASGPSKTSDIQQTLAYGAHGPRWMWVVIVMDEAKDGVEP